MATLAPKGPRVFESSALEKASELGRRNMEPYARARLETYREYLKTARLAPLPRDDASQTTGTGENNKEGA